MKPIVTPFVAALAALTLVAAPAQDRPVIKVAFPKEAPLKFKSTVKTDMDMMGQAMTSTMSMAQTVSVVGEKEGWTTVRFTTDDFKMEGDGMMGMGGDMAAVKDVAIKLEVDASGKTRNVVLENTEKLDPMTRQMMTGSMRSDQVAGFMGIHFPKEAIGVGSKWAVELDASQMFDKSEFITSVSGKLPVSYEVTGFEVIEGKNNVKVKSLMAGTINMQLGGPAGDMQAVVKLNFDTDYWVDVATGMLTKSAGKATIDNDFGMGTMTQKLTVNVARVN